MYLKSLSENQKNSFLSIAKSLVMADGHFDQREQDMMAQYLVEMNFPSDHKVPSTSYNSSVSVFSDADMQTRKMVLFELLSLALADSEYADEERKMIEDISQKWQIDKEFLDPAQSLSSELLATYQTVSALINE